MATRILSTFSFQFEDDN